MEHSNIHANTRKTEALQAMESLKFQSVNQWSIDAMNAVQEIKDSKVTIDDFMLMCLVKSLSGKSKYTQHEIVKDINTLDGVQKMRIFDCWIPDASDAERCASDAHLGY